MTGKSDGFKGTINLDIRDSKPDWELTQASFHTCLLQTFVRQRSYGKRCLIAHVFHEYFANFAKTGDSQETEQIRRR